MPKGTKLAFTSPEGRLVQGDAFEMNTKDKTGAPRVVKTGPNAGQPAPQAVLVVAFAKTDPAWPAFERQIKSKAAEDFPQLFPRAAAGDFTPTNPHFSFKIQDGDGYDGDGKPNNVKEGHAGHWIVKFTSGFAPKVFNKGHYAPQEQVFKVAGQPAPGPRRGDYVRISGTIEGNDDVARPSVYVNCSLVEFSRPGIEIITGPSAETAFGAGGTSAPAPAGGLTMLNGQSYEAFKAAGWTDEQMIAAGHATRPVVALPPPPPAPVTPPPPPAAPAHIMLTGQNYDQMKAAGWTDEAMIAAGHMAAPVVAPPVPPSGATPPPVPGAPTPPASPPAPPAVTPSPSNPPPPPYGAYAAVPPARTMTPAAQGQTYEAMIAAGWTDAMLVQHGMMLPQ